MILIEECFWILLKEILLGIFNYDYCNYENFKELNFKLCFSLKLLYIYFLYFYINGRYKIEFFRIF